MTPLPATAEPMLDPDRAYDAVASRDERFDGWFIVGVTTTGIYCRPSCPTPVRPKRENTKFFATAAAAQREGFRACKRCRPDASPGSPSWDLRADLVGRAMRLVADGVVDREGVGGLARELAVSERHLHRVLTDELGAGPLAIARAHRAQTARTLVETTDLKFSDVAFAAGFSSIRQFNDTVQEVFATSPRELRRRSTNVVGGGAGEITVRLAYRQPYATEDLLAWFAHRSIAGLQSVEDGVIVRSLRLPGGPSMVRLTIDEGHVRCVLRLSEITDLATAVERCRRLLDLDADPTVIDSSLASDRVLAALVDRRPGLRSPGSVDGFETAVFAVLGQQISVVAACRLAARLVAAHGDEGNGTDVRAFPSPARLAEADLAELGLTRRTQAAIGALARLVASGYSLDPGADRGHVRAALLDINGIGPWTADYVALRALRDPDVLPVGDLVVRQRAATLGLPAEKAELAAHGDRWSPWRTYATHHLWAASPADPGPAHSPRSRSTTGQRSRPQEKKT